MRAVSSILAIMVASASAPWAAAQMLPAVSFSQQGSVVTVANGFVSASFDRTTARLTSLLGRYEGDGDFSGSANLVANQLSMGVGVGLSVETELYPNLTTRSSGLFPRASPLPLTVVQNTADLVSFRISGITEDPVSPITTSMFSFALARASRQLQFNATVAYTPSVAMNLTTIRLSLFLTPASGYWQFTDGLLQRMAQPSAPFFASKTPYSRWYAMGYTGSVDLQFPPGTLPPVSAMYAGGWNGARTGFLHVYASNMDLEQWMTQWAGPFPDAPVAVKPGSAWTSSMLIAPNQYDFPVGNMPVGAANLPVDDVRSIMTAIYGSPSGAIVSHQFAPEGRITPCVYAPGGCYGGTYNYFDPDSFLSVSAMSYTFDPYLFTEIRKLLDTNRGLICRETQATICVAGQLPHHIVDSCSFMQPACVCKNSTTFPGQTDCVSYAALSGATQTGPNIFWVMSALQYVATSGDVAWLQANIDDVRFASTFLFEQYDPVKQMLLVPGSLFIDTFRRANYTTDSNAAMVYLLGMLADAEAFLGNATGAAFYNQTAQNIAAAMNNALWDTTSNDHFLTQRNPDGTSRDFVDYDANLLAIQAGVATGGRAQAILNRVDSGPCTHARATYVSEIPYLSADCFIANTGDSAVTMGRIAWIDGRARLATGGAAAIATALNTVLGPLQRELLANTWMYERYQCGGQPTHNPFYIEYPEVVTLLVAEVKYGLRFSLRTLQVSPIDPTTSFTYAIGQVLLSRTPSSLSGSLPLLSGTRQVYAHGMEPGSYSVTVTGASVAGCGSATVTVGADGILAFCAPVGAGRSFSASLQG